MKPSERRFIVESRIIDNADGRYEEVYLEDGSVSHINCMSYSMECAYDSTKRVEDALKKFAKKFDKKINAIATVETVPFDKKIKAFTIENPSNKDVFIKMYRVIVRFETRKVGYEGYTFVAVLKREMLEGGKHTNVTFPATQFQKEDFSKYYDDQFRCDHCKTNRDRKMVFLFRHETTGADLMIATQCSEGYFGKDVYFALSGMLSTSTESMDKDFDDICCSINRNMDIRDRIDYARLAYGYIISQNNYVSKQKADGYGKRSTDHEIDDMTKHLEMWMFRNERDLLEARGKQIDDQVKYKLIADSRGYQYNDIKEYWEAKMNETPEDNFVRNVAINFSLMNVKYGMITYAVFVYLKEVVGIMKEEKKSELPSNHMGNVGDRLKNLEVIVTRVSYHETAYGTSSFVGMIDKDGNKYIWFASGKIHFDQDEAITMDATVKKHDEYKGTKQTVLTRCKVKEVKAK